MLMTQTLMRPSPINHEAVIVAIPGLSRNARYAHSDADKSNAAFRVTAIMVACKREQFGNIELGSRAKHADKLVMTCPMMCIGKYATTRNNSAQKSSRANRRVIP